MYALPTGYTHNNYNDRNMNQNIKGGCKILRFAH